MRRQKRQDDFESFSTRVGRASNDQTRVANGSMSLRVRASRLFVLSIQRASETVGDSRAKRGPKELYGFDWLGILANSRGSPSSGRMRCFTSRISWRPLCRHVTRM